MSTSNSTQNYGLSQYLGGDIVSILSNLNGDMAKIDAALKAIKDETDAAVPSTRKIAGLAMNADITLAQLLSAGLCSAPVSGVWVPTMYGETVAGSPTYALQRGNYYKIGALVILYNIAVRLTSKGGMTGPLHIGGLPFVPSTFGVCTVTAADNGISLGSYNIDQYSNSVSTGIDTASIADGAEIWVASGFYVAQ